MDNSLLVECEELQSIDTRIEISIVGMTGSVWQI